MGKHDKHDTATQILDNFVDRTIDAHTALVNLGASSNVLIHMARAIDAAKSARRQHGKDM